MSKKMLDAVMGALDDGRNRAIAAHRRLIVDEALRLTSDIPGDPGRYDLLRAALRLADQQDPDWLAIALEEELRARGKWATDDDV